MHNVDREQQIQKLLNPICQKNDSVMGRAEAKTKIRMEPGACGYLSEW
jgi:hypothetical protein